MVWANRSADVRSTRSAETLGKLGSSAVSNYNGTTDQEGALASCSPALSGTQAAAVKTALAVRQILPQLVQKISDWRDYQPQKITIAPHTDLEMDFEMTAVRQENGRTVWRGRNALTGAFLVTVATQNDWHAVLEIPAASSFEFHITGQTASVTEKYETGICGSKLHLADADLAQGTVVLSADPNSSSDSSNEGGSSSACADNVDVLFFFDAATFAANGNCYATIDTAIAARVESANVVLENSRVKKFRWRYVAAYQVPEYATSEKLENDLSTVTFIDNSTGQFVADKCALHGVDQAVVYVTGTRDYAGIAWVPSGDDSLAHFAAVVWSANYTVLAHELAHNFGCHHDRTTENVSADDGKTSYGFRFTLNGSDTGTVMSYAPTRVPYFSNPDISYRGISLGVANGKSGAANNASLLASKASLMEAHATPSLVPIITMQPQATTAVRGSSLSLSVFAAGDDLTYQWRKNGSAIAGATDTVYSKSIASDDDVGAYDVIVTNDAGTATSASASVAVASAAVETTAQSTTSSQSQTQSGGGGAPSDWFFAALAVVGLLRVIRRKG